MLINSFNLKLVEIFYFSSKKPNCKPAEVHLCLLVYSVLQKPVFAPDSQPSDDLGQFFQECKNPPNLDMFSGPTALDINSALVSLNNHNEVII